MKNLLSLLLIIFVSTTVFSQGIIERNYEHYVDQEDVTHVYVSGKLFDFASIIVSGSDDPQLKDLSDFAASIQSFSLIKVPNNNKAASEYNKGIQDVKGEYEELLLVRDEGTKFALFVDEEDDIVYELVGLGIDDGEFIAFSLVGEMDLNKISDFISKADEDVFTPLKRLNDFDTDEMKLYPNPTNVSSELNVEVPESMIGGTATLYNTNGVKVKTFKVNNSKESIMTDGLQPGNYFVELNKESLSIRKQVIIVQ